jgi:hypothetical protein
MLNTYIKNRGIAKNIIHDNNDKHVNMINWDADYDGEIANISIDSNSDGKRNHYDFLLDNQDLANILSMPSVIMPIDKRLKIDFQKPYYSPENYLFELPTTRFQPRKPEYLKQNIDRYISSPSTHEELVIPLKIDKKHRRAKSHITYKVYKKPKSTSKKTKSRSKSRPSSKKTIPIIDLI